jgi:hypothetical protein
MGHAMLQHASQRFGLPEILPPSLSDDHEVMIHPHALVNSGHPKTSRREMNRRDDTARCVRCAREYFVLPTAQVLTVRLFAQAAALRISPVQITSSSTTRPSPHVESELLP